MKIEITIIGGDGKPVKIKDFNKLKDVLLNIPIEDYVENKDVKIDIVLGPEVIKE